MAMMQWMTGWGAPTAQRHSGARPALPATVTGFWRGASERLASVSAEFTRRRTLALAPCPPEVRGPALSRLVGELATPWEVWQASRAPSPAAAPGRIEPRVVMLIPGFGTHSGRMRPLGRALEAAGHRVSDWGLGLNLGASAEGFDRLCGHVVALAEREGEPVALVGWSLGGVLAREVAKLHADAVRMVVTMGSPFSGDLRANNGWRAYQAIAGHPVDEPPVGCDIAAKPPVPTIALWSPRDGIVSARSARGRKGERDAAIMLRCTHLGFAGHPEVAGAVLRCLAAETGPR